MSSIAIISALLSVTAMMSPNTGDGRNPVILIVIGVIAVVLIAITAIISKKNKK